MRNITVQAAAVLSAVVASISCMVGSAQAQSKLVNVPAEEYAIAPGGVDMRTGRYVYSQTDLTIAGEAGLSLTRTMPNYAAAHANPFGNFSHNWDIMLLESRPDFVGGNHVGSDYRMSVYFGGRSLTFDSPQNAVGYAYNGTGPSTFLTFTNGTKASGTTTYSLRAPDGTVLNFRPIGNLDCANIMWGSAPRRCAFISEMVQPDGTKLTFNYDYNSGASGNRARLKSVVSSRGYALLLEGSGSLVSAACVINLSQLALPGNGLCPSSGVLKATYAYSGSSLSSVTDPAGATSSFTYGVSGSQKLMRFIKPGQSTPWLVNTISMRNDEEWVAQEIIDSQAFSTGESYTYLWGLTPFTNDKPNQTIAGGRYTNGAGQHTVVRYDFPVLPASACPQLPCPPQNPDDPDTYTYQQTSGPAETIDRLGRSTLYDYCDPVAMAGFPPQFRERCIVMPLQSFTDPEGIKTILKYDGSTNVIEVRRKAKPGSGLADVVTSATYNCTYPASCTKPITMTDAKGAISNYSYDPVHGGLLTAMKPAPTAGSARALIVRTYVQKYAYVTNGSSLVPMSTSVWMPATETECQTAAGSSTPVCDGGAPQKVTTYEYGADGTADNLLLRGVAITADGTTLRTCNGYDAFGRKISETKPNANLSVCP